MLEVAIPETAQHDVDLVPERLLYKDANSSISGRLSIGEPVVISLAVEKVAGDSELAAFVMADAADSSYCLLHLSCTFRPDRSSSHRPFLKAGLGVELSADGGGRQPIAWSLAPRRRTHRSSTSKSLKIGARLAIIDSSLEIVQSSEREEVYLLSFGERQSDPEWRLTRTPMQEIEGDESFAVVVRMPNSAASRAEVMLSAVIRQHRLGVSASANLPPIVRTVELSKFP